MKLFKRKKKEKEQKKTISKEQEPKQGDKPVTKS
jgi:hypothetical protein